MFFNKTIIRSRHFGLNDFNRSDGTQESLELGLSGEIHDEDSSAVVKKPSDVPETLRTSLEVVVRIA